MDNTNLKVLRELTTLLNDKDEELRRANDRFRRFFELQSVPMAIFNAKNGGEFVDVNRAFVKILGWNKEDLIGRNFEEFIVEDHLEETNEFVKKTYEQGIQGVNLVNRYKTKNGSEKWLRWNGTAPDEDGYTQYICEDITNQIEVAQQLEHQMELLEVLATNGNDLVALHDKEGKYKYLSPNWPVITGYTLDELIGKDVSDMLNKEDLQCIRDTQGEREKIYLRGESSTVITRFRKKDGSVIWLESVVSPIKKDHKMAHYHSSSRDISENIRMRNTLQAREEMYKSLLQNPGSFVKLFDTIGNTVYCSDSCEDFTGYTAEEHSKHDPLSLIHDEDKVNSMKALHLAIDTKEEQEIIIRGKHKDGHWVKTKSRVVPIIDPFGDVNYVMTISNKVNE